MPRTTVCLLLALLTAACRATPDAEAGARDYVLVVLRSGPQAAGKSDAERAELQQAHMANINRLAKEGVLWVAGPFGRPNPDPTRRGIFVLAVGDLARAAGYASTDPAVQAGTLSMELLPLRTSAALERAHELDLQVDADLASGKLAQFPMHTYTFAIVGGGAEARAALEQELAPGRVLLVGALGGRYEGSSLALLDAPDVERANELLAPVRERLGALDLAPWFASATLARLPELAAGAGR